jgi:salicylate hydroxylase
VQLQSRAVGEHIFHPDGVHAQLRNAIMRAKTPAEWYDTLAWLYGGYKQNAASDNRAAA